MSLASVPHGNFEIQWCCYFYPFFPFVLLGSSSFYRCVISWICFQFRAIMDKTPAHLCFYLSWVNRSKIAGSYSKHKLFKKLTNFNKIIMLLFIVNNFESSCSFFFLRGKDIFFKCANSLCTYEQERKRERRMCMWAVGRGRERGREDLPGSTPSMGLHLELDPTTLTSWPEPKSRVKLNQLSHPGTSVLFKNF